MEGGEQLYVLFEVGCVSLVGDYGDEEEIQVGLLLYSQACKMVLELLICAILPNK